MSFFPPSLDPTARVQLSPPFPGLPSATVQHLLCLAQQRLVLLGGETAHPMPGARTLPGGSALPKGGKRSFGSS